MIDLSLVNKQISEQGFLALCVAVMDNDTAYTTKVVKETRQLAREFETSLIPFPEIEAKLKAFAEQIKEEKPEDFDEEKHWNFIMWSFWNEVDNLLP